MQKRNSEKRHLKLCLMLVAEWHGMTSPHCTKHQHEFWLFNNEKKKMIFLQFFRFYFVSFRCSICCKRRKKENQQKQQQLRIICIIVVGWVLLFFLIHLFVLNRRTEKKGRKDVAFICLQKYINIIRWVFSSCQNKWTIAQDLCSLHLLMR